MASVAKQSLLPPKMSLKEDRRCPLNPDTDPKPEAAADLSASNNDSVSLSPFMLNMYQLSRSSDSSSDSLSTSRSRQPMFTESPDSGIDSAMDHEDQDLRHLSHSRLSTSVHVAESSAAAAYGTFVGSLGDVESCENPYSEMEGCQQELISPQSEEFPESSEALADRCSSGEIHRLQEEVRHLMNMTSAGEMLLEDEAEPSSDLEEEAEDVEMASGCLDIDEDAQFPDGSADFDEEDDFVGE